MWLITQLRANIPRCAAKIQIFSQTNVKMLRLFLYLQQFNVFSRLSAIIYLCFQVVTFQSPIVRRSGSKLMPTFTIGRPERANFEE